MVAVDTNVVVRLLTGDDPGQTARARAVFENETVLLAKTVILESEWVLRRLYQFDSSSIADSFSALMGLPNLVCEDAEDVADAIRWMRDGLDFADALHLTAAKAAGRFATFDLKLAKRAADLTGVAMIRA